MRPITFFISPLIFILMMTFGCIPTKNNSSNNGCIDESKIRNVACPAYYEPVCGCDGKTYGNTCEASRAGVTKWTEGKCKSDQETSCIDESKINPDVMCAAVYEPVCGCDGKTYGNTCEASREGVTQWTEGECNTSKKTSCIDESKIRRDVGCAEIYQPVCGCDGKTYGNQCEAENAGVTKWVDGRCKQKNTCIDESKIRPDMICTREYAPVCGCNGKTYSNSCEAKKAGLTDWEKGDCDKKTTVPRGCIDEQKIDTKRGCTKIYRPVCGCDGKTYGNECEAERAGLTEWKPGKCKE